MFNQQHIRLKGENGVLSASTFISIRKVACREDHSAEYALPAVLVSNKNGRKRLLYQNYRKLNESLIRDNNPMAHMENVLDKLQGYKRLTLFTKFIMAVLRELIAKNFVVSGRH